MVPAMRRKSERNKAKGSPEKKSEKPTRKSTRRRGKRSPSTSPERENSGDATSASSALPSTARDRNDDNAAISRTRDFEKTNETPEADVTSTEVKQPDDEETTAAAACVWKVARADASPGEIQKLKLCRQRNMSETSDASSSRKRGGKWQDVGGGSGGGCSGGGEGTTEEIDSGDERGTILSSKTIVDNVVTSDEIASVIRGRESGDEVSDSKEFPTVIANAELSDVEPKIDEGRRNDETPVMIAVDAIATRVDNNATETLPSDVTNVTTMTNPANEMETSDENIAKDENAPVSIVKNNNEDNVEAIDESIERESVEKERAADDKDEPGESKETSSDDNNDNKIEEKTTKGNRKSRDDSSEDNTDEDRDDDSTRKTQSRMANRRKHRDKYRDSSESAETEEERDDARDERNNELKKIPEDAVIIEETNDVNEISRTPVNKMETMISHETHAVENKNIEDEKIKANDEDKRLDEIAVPATNFPQSQANYKPAKVNLKRSFSARPSIENVETKKDATENDANDLANQDKENHASGDQIDPKSIPKKRRWGTILAASDPTPAFSVSTDSLKVLVPGAKPLPINEVRLTKDDDEDRDRWNKREKRYSTSESVLEHKITRDDGEKTKNAETKKDAKGDNHIASRRKISIVKDTQHAKSPSPPAAIPTSILLIKNLVRPFTLNQIRELLSRTGTIVENGFWMDRIKSKCFVEYTNEDQAFETRQALHGISWPVSNPKRLQVEYATKEDMELARELAKDQPASRKAEPLATSNDGWQQDWARDERTNSTTKVTVVREWDLGKEDGQHFAKDKEREKKELEKKRRQRSRSPTLEAHLPAPARKFKKKEDDPPPAKLLDDLFRKTKATPCIYWLPLTNEQIVVKEEMRRQHMAEHARRLEEMRRAERNRDGRRRRSPRK